MESSFSSTLAPSRFSPRNLNRPASKSNARQTERLMCLLVVFNRRSTENPSANRQIIFEKCSFRSDKHSQPGFLGVFHLPKNSGNSGWVVNGTWLFGSFHWKISGKKRNSWKGSPVFPVETSQWKCVFHLQISRLYHQFHAFRRLSSGQASLVFQQKWRLIRVRFLEAFCKQTFRATASALPARYSVRSGKFIVARMCRM